MTVQPIVEFCLVLYLLKKTGQLIMKIFSAAQFILYAVRRAMGDPGPDSPGPMGNCGASIAVLMEELERVSYEMIQAPTVLTDMAYSFENQNRPIRVYRSVDPRLVLEDFFAKLAINFGS